MSANGTGSLAGVKVLHLTQFRVKPAQLPGEYNEAVLNDWLGLNDDEIADLKIDGVL